MLRSTLESAILSNADLFIYTEGEIFMEIYEVVDTQDGFETPFESGVNIWCCLFCCCC